MLKLDKAICIFDIEASGKDPGKDRLVQLAIMKWDGINSEWLEILCNPDVIMSDEVIAIHGITNEAVANLPKFKHFAKEVYTFLIGCDLAGFNLLNYDVPLLWSELWNAGIEWDIYNNDTRIIDVGNIFKKKEERSLSAAVEFYCNREHIGAHGALADTQATLDVFLAQCQRYPDLCNMTVAELAEYSRFNERLDLAGKIIKGPDGRPTYNIGKCRGVAVEDDIGFGEWMLRRDFPANTQFVLRRILDKLYEKEQTTKIAFASTEYLFDLPNDMKSGPNEQDLLLSDEEECPF